MARTTFDPAHGLDALGELSRAIAIPTGRDELSVRALAVIVAALRAAGGAVFHQDDGGTLHLGGSEGDALEVDPSELWARGRAGLAGSVKGAPEPAADGWISIALSSDARTLGSLVLHRPAHWSPAARAFAFNAAQVLACGLGAAAQLSMGRDQSELLARRSLELEALRDLSGELQDLDSEQEVLRVALDVVLERMGLQAGWIFWGDSLHGRLELAASRGVSEAFVSRARTSGIGTCLCADVFETGRLRLARNTIDCPRLPELVSGTDPMTHACIPLKFERGTLGVMNIANKPGQLFTAPELQFLETVGGHVCLAVNKVRTAQAEQQRNAEARALVALAKAIGGSLEIDRILAAVGEYAHELLAVDRCAVFLGNDPSRLQFAYLSGAELKGLTVGTPVDFPALQSRGFLEVLSTRRTLVVHDATADPRANPELARAWDSGSVILVPLLSHEHVEGVLMTSRPLPSRWTEQEVTLADGLGKQAAVAVENARLYREAQEAIVRLQEAQYGMMRAERLAAVGTLASSLAHEVRNPLNSINLQLVLLSRRVGRMEPALQAEVSGLVETARLEIERLDALVQEFLSLSTIDRISRAEVNPAEVVREVVHLMAPVARERSVSLNEEYGDRLPRMSLDREKIKQVLINLVRNSIEAMPDGGTVILSMRRTRNSLILGVTDSGGGIEPGLDVFDFFMTTKRGGTGLGLPIARRIVEAHGGTLTYTSEPGGGTTFLLTLPAPEQTGSESP